MKTNTPLKRRRVRAGLPALDWVRDATGRCARVTAMGAGSLLVENHTGIADISDCRIRLNTRSGPLCVTGTALSLRDVRPGALIIRGGIRLIELPCEGGEAPDEP